MNRYLEGAAHVIQTETDAAQALENLLRHPAYRWRIALRGARAVMRAHTTQHRLVQMFRTAGMVIAAPQAPALHVYAGTIAEAFALQLLKQTLRPSVVVADQWVAGAKALLEQSGVICKSSSEAQPQAGQLWLLADSFALDQLEHEDFEDLAWTASYAPQNRLGFLRDAVLANQLWPGVAVEAAPIDKELQLLRLKSGMPLNGLATWASTQSTLALRKPNAAYEQAPNISPQKTVLIAGHDLKFIKPFYPYFGKSGIRILLDFWSGHNQHNEATSKRLVDQADIIFCEWMLGNAIWYAKNKRKGQKLVGRLHAQELRSALFDKVPFEQFETVIFVGPHMLRQAKIRNPVFKKNGVVIYNGVDVEALQSVPRKPTNGKVLGFVGIVPQSKRLDLALDILRELRREDSGYILRIKGKRPEDFPWMANRPEEMAWYDTQYQRLEQDPLLKEAVIFDPHGNDMPEWYSGVDYVLSTSDFESFHFTVADGAAAGCVPVVLAWDGADEIYLKDWVHLDVNSATKYIKQTKSNKNFIQSQIDSKFKISLISCNIIDVLYFLSI